MEAESTFETVYRYPFAMKNISNLQVEGNENRELQRDHAFAETIQICKPSEQDSEDEYPHDRVPSHTDICTIHTRWQQIAKRLNGEQNINLRENCERHAKSDDLRSFDLLEITDIDLYDEHDVIMRGLCMDAYQNERLRTQSKLCDNEIQPLTLDLDLRKFTIDSTSFCPSQITPATLPSPPYCDLFVSRLLSQHHYTEDSDYNALHWAYSHSRDGDLEEDTDVPELEQDENGYGSDDSQSWRDSNLHHPRPTYPGLVRRYVVKAEAGTQLFEDSHHEDLGELEFFKSLEKKGQSRERDNNSRAQQPSRIPSLHTTEKARGRDHKPDEPFGVNRPRVDFDSRVGVTEHPAKKKGAKANNSKNNGAKKAAGSGNGNTGGGAKSNEAGGNSGGSGASGAGAPGGGDGDDPWKNDIKLGDEAEKKKDEEEEEAKRKQAEAEEAEEAERQRKLEEEAEKARVEEEKKKEEDRLAEEEALKKLAKEKEKAAEAAAAAEETARHASRPQTFDDIGAGMLRNSDSPPSQKQESKGGGLFSSWFGKKNPTPEPPAPPPQPRNLQPQRLAIYNAGSNQANGMPLSTADKMRLAGQEGRRRQEGVVRAQAALPEERRERLKRETEVRAAAERKEQEEKDREKARLENEEKERLEREEKERAEREEKERAEREEKERLEREEKKRAEREEKERAEREEKKRAEKEQKERAEREEKKRAEKEQKERLEREEKKRTEREEKERAEREEHERREKEKKIIEEQERLEREEKLKMAKKEEKRKQEEASVAAAITSASKDGDQIKQKKQKKTKKLVEVVKPVAIEEKGVEPDPPPKAPSPPVDKPVQADDWAAASTVRKKVAKKGKRATEAVKGAEAKALVVAGLEPSAPQLAPEPLAIEGPTEEPAVEEARSSRLPSTSRSPTEKPFEYGNSTHWALGLATAFGTQKSPGRTSSPINGRLDTLIDMAVVEAKLEAEAIKSATAPAQGRDVELERESTTPPPLKAGKKANGTVQGLAAKFGGSVATKKEKGKKVKTKAVAERQPSPPILSDPQPEPLAVLSAGASTSGPEPEVVTEDSVPKEKCEAGLPADDSPGHIDPWGDDDELTQEQLAAEPSPGFQPAESAVFAGPPAEGGDVSDIKSQRSGKCSIEPLEHLDQHDPFQDGEKADIKKEKKSRKIKTEVDANGSPVKVVEVGITDLFRLGKEARKNKREKMAPKTPKKPTLEIPENGMPNVMNFLVPDTPQPDISNSSDWMKPSKKERRKLDKEVAPGEVQVRAGEPTEATSKIVEAVATEEAPEKPTEEMEPGDEDTAYEDSRNKEEETNGGNWIFDRFWPRGSASKPEAKETKEEPEEPAPAELAPENAAPEELAVEPPPPPQPQPREEVTIAEPELNPVPEPEPEPEEEIVTKSIILKALGKDPSKKRKKKGTKVEQILRALEAEADEPTPVPEPVEEPKVATKAVVAGLQMPTEQATEGLQASAVLFTEKSQLEQETQPKLEPVPGDFSQDVPAEIAREQESAAKASAAAEPGALTLEKPKRDKDWKREPKKHRSSSMSEPQRPKRSSTFGLFGMGVGPGTTKRDSSRPKNNAEFVAVETDFTRQKGQGLLRSATFATPGSKDDRRHSMITSSKDQEEKARRAREKEKGRERDNDGERELRKKHKIASGDHRVAQTPGEKKRNSSAQPPPPPGAFPTSTTETKEDQKLRLEKEERRRKKIERKAAEEAIQRKEDEERKKAEIELRRQLKAQEEIQIAKREEEKRAAKEAKRKAREAIIAEAQAKALREVQERDRVDKERREKARAEREARRQAELKATEAKRIEAEKELERTRSKRVRNSFDKSKEKEKSRRSSRSEGKEKSREKPKGKSQPGKSIPIVPKVQTLNLGLGILPLPITRPAPPLTPPASDPDQALSPLSLETPISPTTIPSLDPENGKRRRRHERSKSLSTTVMVATAEPSPPVSDGKITPNQRVQMKIPMEVEGNPTPPDEEELRRERERRRREEKRGSKKENMTSEGRMGYEAKKAARKAEKEKEKAKAAGGVKEKGGKGNEREKKHREHKEKGKEKAHKHREETPEEKVDRRVARASKKEKEAEKVKESPANSLNGSSLSNSKAAKILGEDFAGGAPRPRAISRTNTGGSSWWKML